MGRLLEEARRRGELMARVRREGAAFVDGWSLAEARRIVREVLAGSGVDAWLFGSRAPGGSPRPFSDLDIALDGHGERVSPLLASQVREALEEGCIPFTADVVDLADAPGLAEAVSRGVRWTD